MASLRKLLFLNLALLPCLFCHAQIDSVALAPTATADTLPEPAMQMVLTEPDSADAAFLRLLTQRDSLNAALDASSRSVLAVNDTLQAIRLQLLDANAKLNHLSELKDSLVMSNSHFQKELEEKNRLLEEKIRALQEKELMVAEKEQLYKEALNNSNVDKAKLEGDIKAKEISINAKAREIEYLQKDIDAKETSLSAQRANYELLTRERDRYAHLVDSLRARVIAADMENIKKQEENKYLAQRAKEAEDKVNTATNRKKKVRPIQGIAMRFFRTPDWNIRLTPVTDGQTTTFYKQVWNRNSGNIEFDYVTGASVMLWDMTNIFNAPTEAADSMETRITDLRPFDQQFAYDLGLYVGFGGSNLFKNFYVGPSFRFVDFFYLTFGVNISEYEVLSEGYTDRQILSASETLESITAKTWLVKPFVSLSIDLDFLSYIKK